MFSHFFNWHTLKVFVASYVAFVVLHTIWFCYVVKGMYTEKLAGIAIEPEMNMFSQDYLLMLLGAALLVAGIIIFVLPHTHGDYMYAFVKGGVYGLIISATHQIKNFVTIAHWPMEIVWYSVAAEVVLCALVTVLAVKVAELGGCRNIYGCTREGKKVCQ